MSFRFIAPVKPHLSKKNGKWKSFALFQGFQFYLAWDWCANQNGEYFSQYVIRADSDVLPVTEGAS